MAENANGSWNLRIPPESIHTASGKVGEIVNQIVKTYNAINQEIGVTLQAWSGIAQDRHVAIFNEDAEMYNDYIDDMQYEAFRLFVVSDAYAKTEQKNVERGSVLRTDIF
ncbi:MAG TPA: hypothetical protein DCF66_04240 [Lachnospiraceae bacterium]|jgi:uncharacterized protein YukE|nr:hypothetical protein [Lachnospiraceae bacterium]